MFMDFLPGISLVILRRQFVAEVRWLFPVSRQKKRESGKQRNTEPWRWDLNENAAFSEISATCSPINIANILRKSSVPVYCLFDFACLFFLLWQFFCLFLFSVYKPASEYWNRVKRWTFQKMTEHAEFVSKATKFYACYHDFVFLTIPHPLFFSAPKSQKYNFLLSVQVGYVKSEKAWAPLSSS